MTDIVERLLLLAAYRNDDLNIFKEAAEEIKRLRQRVKELEDSLNAAYLEDRLDAAYAAGQINGELATLKAGQSEPVATMTIRDDMGVEIAFIRSMNLNPGDVFYLTIFPKETL